MIFVNLKKQPIGIVVSFSYMHKVGSRQKREKQKKRVIEWLGLEGTSGIIKLQPPCQKKEERWESRQIPT